MCIHDENIVPQVVYNETLADLTDIREIIRIMEESINKKQEIQVMITWWHPKHKEDP